jgi:hypothetical protein
MLATDIRTYLIACGVGTASNVFAGPLNENVAAGIGIFEKYGRAPDKIANLEFPDFDVMARGLTKYAAYVLAHNAYYYLHQQTDLLIGSTLYKRIEATGSPNYFGKDNLDRFIYIGGFTTIKTIEPDISAALFLCGPEFCGMKYLKSGALI